MAKRAMITALNGPACAMRTRTSNPRCRMTWRTTQDPVGGDLL